MTRHVVSVGDLVLDVIMPVRLPVLPGAHQEIHGHRVEPGGAANFMIAARRMGLHVSAAGAVGSDVFGQHILATLEAEGVDVGCVSVLAQATSTLVIVLTDQQSGAHTFVGSYGNSAEAPYPPELDRRIQQADALFIEGYTLADQRTAMLGLRTIDEAQACGVPVYLDVGPFMGSAQPQHVQRAVAGTAVLLMTEDELPFVTGERDRDRAYQGLLAQGPHTLVVKHGEQGCTVITPDGRAYVPGYPVRAVIDTVGAGDCFAGAFLAGQLQGLGLVDSVRLANAMGAATVQKVGAGTNAPTCDEVLAVLARAGERIEFSC